MTEVFIAADNILSPLGNTTAENMAQLRVGNSGIQQHDNPALSDIAFYASLFAGSWWAENGMNNTHTRFEQLLVKSIANALAGCDINPSDEDTLLIISTTKGNIELLQTGPVTPELKERIALTTSAKLVARHFGFAAKPVVVSNACISGLLGILTGLRLIRAGRYKNVVVAGADTLSKFVLSGFQSFQAISPEACRPFDKDRNGINLGEGAGTIILSSDKRHSSGIKVTGGGTGNDANHISGPSRTGAELFQVIKTTLDAAHLTAQDIDFISAHGTATIYNDEMEARAIALAHMLSAPVNSLKGYFGHTLGAAGIIESIVTVQSMRDNLIIPSKGFEQIGVSQPINVCSNLQEATLNHCLKTASGFGGCNGAILFSKSNPA
jgi:3-oxoacyl-[acyl-carrier-protein] synthase-1